MSLIENLGQAEFINIYWQVVATLSFILADILTGFICAIIMNNLDSQKMREGLLRKMLLILIMGLGFILQYGLFNFNFVSKSVCIYIIIMETVSILENVQKAGVDLGAFGNLFKIKEGNNNEKGN